MSNAEIKCDDCQKIFMPLENFVVHKVSENESVRMCMSCFYSLALYALDCKEAMMNYEGDDYILYN